MILYLISTASYISFMEKCHRRLFMSSLAIIFALDLLGFPVSVNGISCISIICLGLQYLGSVAMADLILAVDREIVSRTMVSP